jgi:dynein heavy chain
LFEKDKLLYSFLIASKILIYDKKINSTEWNFFLRGGTGDPPLP